MRNLEERTDDPIVVTGLGAVSPLGVGVATNWKRLIAGQSGIVTNTRFDTADYGCKIAGLVPTKQDDPHGFDALDHMDAKDMRKMDLFIQYSLAATEEALAQAGWKPEDEEQKDRTATIIATGVGGFPVITQAVTTVQQRGPRKLSPFVVPSFLANLAAGQVSIRYGFSGPVGCPVTACAASLQAIGDGMRLIASGEADVAVCGGADACVDPVSIGGFSAARALSVSHNAEPQKASRPFDKGHDGFVLSEGAATLVLERLSHARKRGTIPLAMLAGYGTTADAYHVTAGRPDGSGAARSMRLALKMAGADAADIDYINGHSTSTPVGDAAEIAAIRSVFPQRGKDLAVTSSKSAIGHLLGAAGAIEAVYSVLALREDLVPPGLNIDESEADADIFELSPNKVTKKRLNSILSNGFGFGGVNAALVMRKVS
ncbi:3-oxoacyl-[acyl-carrier-protein] synthase II [Cohaesibacter sp. ES.047]|uniref:beta-ketoacyl-ACP synthase II n=1 Tax=Cohaesibacter sp. ES.047 TaxID=1798205 RepID=UPI000BB73C50|nr:beta-ketoacyl-ACP synthase II [Cohaesibacter sp. ES.047]SNY92121.1 3-oxoacyl-[acyl-carrier-protein] synthase II [Cohaesibacter sp. ES.047]